MRSDSTNKNCDQCFKKIIGIVADIIINPQRNWFITLPLFLFECALSIFIVYRIPYTEIDWVAYMQEVEGYLNGTFDYAKLAGQTGPLVYPAGFVYFFSFLYHLTDHGTNIRLAQYIFILLFLLNLVLVFNLYVKTKSVPPFALVFMCCTSYRIHSIYMLRLFNDPVAMLFIYAAINALLYERYSLACLCYSFGVSIKMNGLLFAPGLLVILLCNRGVWETIGHLAECALTQVLLALPFLTHNALNYLSRAFEFQRQFLFKWTVNWRFLPLWIFEHRGFHALLLGAHILFLVVYIYLILRNYCSKRKSGPSIKFELSLPDKESHLDDRTMLLLLFVSNFIGVAFSRSLHYQFYVWYYHTLVFLVWRCPYPNSVRLLMLGLIEMCWNVYPSTNWSSALLHTQHLLILLGLAKSYWRHQWSRNVKFCD